MEKEKQSPDQVSGTQKDPELEQAESAISQLWQVTQSAAQPAQVHVQCQQLKDWLLEYVRRPKG